MVGLVSLIVTVALTVGDGDSTTLVSVGRVESVLPVSIEGTNVDIIDLTRAALGRLISEITVLGDEQVLQLRQLFGGAG